MFLCVSFKNTSGKNVYEVYKKYILKNNTFFFLYFIVMYFIFYLLLVFLHIYILTYLLIYLLCICRVLNRKQNKCNIVWFLVWYWCPFSLILWPPTIFSYKIAINKSYIFLESKSKWLNVNFKNKLLKIYIYITTKKNFFSFYFFF